MSTAIVIFAKAPQAGLAKTRLIPALGAEGAARLAEKMLFHAVKQAMDTRFDHIELCVTPDAQHSTFQTLAQQYRERLQVSKQRQGDLGQRMFDALTRTLRHHAHVLLTGTDAPALTARRLREATQALSTNDACFVPATDGGYTLAGFKTAYEPLFVNMPWSTPNVMAMTRERLLALGCTWHELSPIADIDEPGDLVHVPPEWLP